MYFEKDRTLYYIAAVSQGEMINTAVLDGVRLSAKITVWGFHTNLAFESNPADVTSYNPPVVESGLHCASDRSTQLQAKGMSIYQLTN